MPLRTPEDRMTGRKKITRATVLPLNCWFRMKAITKLRTSVAKELTSMRVISSVRFVAKLLSTLRA